MHGNSVQTRANDKRLRPTLNRIWERLRDRGIQVGLLLPVGIIAFLYLHTGRVAPHSAPSLFLDQAFTLAAPVCILALALLFVVKREIAQWLALFISMFGLGFGIVLVIAASTNRAPDMRVMVVAFVAIVCSVVMLFRSQMLIARLHTLQAKMIAVLAAALLPALQLWQATFFLPANLQPSLGLKIDVESRGQEGANNRSSVILTMENSSDIRVIILISDLQICGSQNAPAPNAPPPNDCQVFTPFYEGSWIDVRNTAEYRIAITTPIAEPYLQVQLRVKYARGDRLVWTEDRATSVENCKDVRTVNIEEPSRYLALATRPDRLVYSNKFDQDNNYLDVRITPESIDPCRTNGTSRDRELEKSYGLTTAIRLWETWVQPPH